MKRLAPTHCKKISEGLIRYHQEKAYAKTTKGPKMELRQKRAILLSLLRKRDREGEDTKLKHEIDKVGRDIRRMNKRIK